jgi:hypothetical protein
MAMALSPDTCGVKATSGRNVDSIPAGGGPRERVHASRAPAVQGRDESAPKSPPRARSSNDFIWALPGKPTFRAGFLDRSVFYRDRATSSCHRTARGVDAERLQGAVTDTPGSGIVAPHDRLVPVRRERARKERKNPVHPPRQDAWKKRVERAGFLPIG